jgi:multimeric flavodoxin WrbA
MQYVHYLQKTFPQHEMEIINIAQRIKRIERNEQVFEEIVDKVRASDGVLWAFPLYILHVHAHYKRFIELIWEQGAVDAFADKHAASLSTSIHYFDHTAHNYVQAICDDLGMKYVSAYSPEMRDLLDELERAKFVMFAERFFDAIEKGLPMPRRYAPVVWEEVDYSAGPVTSRVSVDGKRVVLLTDAEPNQTNLLAMIDRFKDSFSGGVKVFKLHDLEIRGSCLGCLSCGYNYECAYLGKDGFIDFYNTELKTADVLVFAGAIKDRYLSSTWKTFFDRSFFNTHTPSLVGKQFAFLISGPLSQNGNLQQILEAWVQLQQSNLVGMVSDEFGDSVQIDALLQDLAGRLVEYATLGYIKPQTFLGVGGMKVFRDDIYGRLRTVFQADHRAYKQMGIYDFPQKDLGVRALNAVTTVLFKVPRIRRAFSARIKQGMIQPYQKVLEV